ncbi:unnamed protein product, partial [Owenia fusiformis]
SCKMIIYVESKAFLHKTFICVVYAHQTIARIRAQILHILYELGREEHQFRLKFRSEFLRDGFTVEDYKIPDNAVIKMVPMSKKQNSYADIKSLSETSSSADLGQGYSADVKQALLKEVKRFDQRERLLFDFKGMLYLHFMASCFAFLTTYWYSGFWTMLVFLFGTYMVPTFTRTGGFIGSQSIYKVWFCVIYGLGALFNAAASVYFCVVEWIRIVNHGCKDWEFVDDCSHQVVFSAIFFGIHGLSLLIASIIVWVLFWNFKMEYGDLIEKHLVQTRDIEKVMAAARSSKVKDRRIAAYELATLASCGDDNKFRIVADGGLEILISMALSSDTATQEHSVEALSEMLTVPAIQDTFVEMGGVKTLTALLHSTERRLIYEAATALSYIVADSEENKQAIVADHGLQDLCHAARHSDTDTQRIVAGIFLDLAFNPEIRAQMTSMNSPAKAMIEMCRDSEDTDTLRFALQTLELLAIESPDMICAQEDLVGVLLNFPSRSTDDKLYLLAGKILLYYAENQQTCEQLLQQPNLKVSLDLYARTRSAVLQKVVAKLIFCFMENKEFRSQARQLELDGILKYIKDNAADREAWDMADEGIRIMNEEPSGVPNLATMSTLEKLAQLEDDKPSYLRDRFGSRGSLSSKSSLRSIDKISSKGSGDVRKGID